MSEYAPVLVSVYHRLYTLKRCIEALRNNVEAVQTDLFIVSDGAARKTDEDRVSNVRKYVDEISGFKSVTLIARPENWGANRSVMGAIEDLLRKFGRLIFMEDDILPSIHYLEYMNRGLDFYDENPQVFAICGYKSCFKLPKKYKYDLFALNRYSPWGVGFWADKYFSVDHGSRNRYDELKVNKPELFEFYQTNDPSFLGILKADSEGRIKAADVRIETDLIYSGQVCIYPRNTMTYVQDTTGDSMHGGGMWMWENIRPDFRPKDFGNIPLEVDGEIYRRFLRSKYPSLWMRFVFALKHRGIGFVVQYYSRRVLHRHNTRYQKVGAE